MRFYKPGRTWKFDWVCYLCSTMFCTGFTFQRILTISWMLLCSVHCCFQEKAQKYLVDSCIPVLEVISSNRQLCSASRHHHTVTRYQPSTFGCRSFLVTGPTLPDRLCDPTLSSDNFSELIKTELIESY